MPIKDKRNDRTVGFELGARQENGGWLRRKNMLSMDQPVALSKDWNKELASLF